MPNIVECEQLLSGINLEQLGDIPPYCGRIKFINKGDIFKPNKDEVIISEGHVSIIHNNTKDLVIGLSFNNIPIGIIEKYSDNINLLYRAETNMKTTSFTWNEFLQLTYNSQEFAILSLKLMANFSINFINDHYTRNASTGYEIIKNMIYKYEDGKRNGDIINDGIASYIFKHTRLSRSYIFHVLSELKLGNYITMKNGKLISINKTLPAKF